jgi:TPR repeat protein
LRDGTGILNNLSEVAHNFRLSADQGNPNGHCHHRMTVLTGIGVERNLRAAVRTFILSAANGNPDGQAVVGRMAGNGIRMACEFTSAVQCYEMCSDISRDGSLQLDRCFQAGRRVWIDFPAGAKLFRKSAHVGSSEGANSLARYLEIGEGIEANTEEAVRYYEKAASKSRPSGLYNIERYLLSPICRFK